MTEEALNHTIRGSERDSWGPVRGPQKAATPRQKKKEVVVRAFSDSDPVKHKAEPEVAREVVSRHFDRHTGDQPLPPLIARFLDTHWRSYMAKIYFLQGERSQAWRTALENTENLTWSLQPKRDDESRRRLYALLPELFQWVHSVLKSARVAVPEEDAFFAELARLQVAALHAAKHSDARPGHDGELQPAGDESLTLGQVGVAENAEMVDSPHSQPGREQAPAQRNQESDVLRNLVIGATVQLQSDRATKRILRLEWISRGGGVYLLRDQKRGDALCLTAARCIQCLRDGSFRVLN